jgi:hypothetical protein
MMIVNQEVSLSCPVRIMVARYQGAHQNKSASSAVRGQWNTVRRAIGASVNGIGYGCGLKQTVRRGLRSIVRKSGLAKQHGRAELFEVMPCVQHSLTL